MIKDQEMKTAELSYRLSNLHPPTQSAIIRTSVNRFFLSLHQIRGIGINYSCKIADHEGGRTQEEGIFKQRGNFGRTKKSNENRC